MDKTKKIYNQIKPFLNYKPLQKSDLLSSRYNANIYLKREDMQKKHVLSKYAVL